MKITFNGIWPSEKITGVKNDFAELVGEEILSISGAQVGSVYVFLITKSGKAIKLHHYQDCFEYVSVEDVDGDPQDLIGALVTSVEEVCNESQDTEDGTQTWTFYKLETSKGGLVIRWNGESNGFYSESVDICGGRVIEAPEQP